MRALKIKFLVLAVTVLTGCGKIEVEPNPTTTAASKITNSASSSISVLAPAATPTPTSTPTPGPTATPAPSPTPTSIPTPTVVGNPDSGSEDLWAEYGSSSGPQQLPGTVGSFQQWTFTLVNPGTYYNNMETYIQYSCNSSGTACEVASNAILYARSDCTGPVYLSPNQNETQENIYALNGALVVPSSSSFSTQIQSMLVYVAYGQPSQCQTYDHFMSVASPTPYNGNGNYPVTLSGPLYFEPTGTTP